MEPELIVSIAAGVGFLLSFGLLIDAIRDRRFVSKQIAEDPHLDAFTKSRLVSETVRVVVLLAFLIVGVRVVFYQRLSDTGVWVLVSIPITITAGSVYSWWSRWKTRI